MLSSIIDAETCLTHSPPAVHTARAIYKRALEIFPTKKTLWLAAAVLEKEHGSNIELESILLQAVKKCPRAETLWLMAAKEKWLSGNVSGARAILLEAFEANPQSEQIWLAAVKLEWENGETGNARILLSKAVRIILIHIFLLLFINFFIYIFFISANNSTITKSMVKICIT